LVDEPTDTALEIQPGEDIELTQELLPEAIAVATPAASRLSMAGLTGSVSQAEKYWPPPRLMLTAATLMLPGKLLRLL